MSIFQALTCQIDLFTVDGKTLQEALSDWAGAARRRLCPIRQRPLQGFAASFHVLAAEL